MNKKLLLAFTLLVILVLFAFNLSYSKTYIEVKNPLRESSDAFISSDLPQTAYKYEILEGSTVEYVSLKRFFTKPEEYVVGSSTDVGGGGWIDFELRRGEVMATFDISSVHTDNSTRDEGVQKLFTSNEAEFFAYLTDFQPEIGNEFEIEVPGKLTLNGIQKDVIFLVNGLIEEETLVAKGTTSINMLDFGITPPSLVNVSTVDDNLDLKFDIKATRIH